MNRMSCLFQPKIIIKSFSLNSFSISRGIENLQIGFGFSRSAMNSWKSFQPCPRAPLIYYQLCSWLFRIEFLYRLRSALAWSQQLTPRDPISFHHSKNCIRISFDQELPPKWLIVRSLSYGVRPTSSLDPPQLINFFSYHHGTSVANH